MSPYDKDVCIFFSYYLMLLFQLFVCWLVEVIDGWVQEFPVYLFLRIFELNLEWCRMYDKICELVEKSPRLPSCSVYVAWVNLLVCITIQDVEIETWGCISLGKLGEEYVVNGFYQTTKKSLWYWDKILGSWGKDYE